MIEADRDDFLLLANVHSIERLIVRVGHLEWNVEKAFVFSKELTERVDGPLRSCEEEVDALGGKQNRPFKPKINADALKKRLEAVPVDQIHKTVARYVRDATGHKMP